MARRESDHYRKQSEFDAWLLEVKKISPDSISKLETKKYFLEYVEDYNTATLPHEKYYNMDAWVKKENERKAHKEAKKASHADGSVNLLADEERLRYAPAAAWLVDSARRRY